MITIHSPKLDRLSHPLFSSQGVCVAALRLDQIHPTIHGNKWFKLKRNLDDFRARGKHRMLSFGGAYSNHLYALAAAGKAFGFETIGVVRGEIVEPLNPILAFAAAQGMQLVPMSREEYRLKESPEVISRLLAQYGEVEIIPEGGSNLLAVEGCAEIVQYLDWSIFDETDDCAVGESSARVVALSCGTATTLAGVVHGLQSSGEANRQTPQVCGVAALRAEGYLRSEADRWLDLVNADRGSPSAEKDAAIRWQVDERYHFGGYAKRTAELDAFVSEFEAVTRIPLEPVYTGKLFYALCDQIARGEYSPGSQIIALHTGGIIR